jgi:GNAT superfamily N-acetyltransferase
VSPIDHTPLTRPAERTDRQGLTRVLTAAFVDDPVFTWLVPDRSQREPLLPLIFDAFAEAFARHDQTHVTGPGGEVTGKVTGKVTGEVTGVALWAPPGVAPVHPDDEAGFGGRLAELAGPHLERFGTCMELFEAAHPAEPAWFLQFLAVDPAHQGHGHGSALLRTVLDGADRAGEAAYLEATSDRNRALYERHGFSCTADLVLPDGPTAYAMWRDPVPAS